MSQTDSSMTENFFLVQSHRPHPCIGRVCVWWDLPAKSGCLHVEITDCVLKRSLVVVLFSSCSVFISPLYAYRAPATDP